MTARPETIEINELVLKLFDDCISPEETERLEQWLEQTPGAAGHYLDLSLHYSFLVKEKFPLCSGYPLAHSVPQLNRFLEELLEQEKTTPTAEVASVKSEPSRMLIQKVERVKVEHKISKSSLFSLIASAAAILFLVVFARISPVQSGTKVAVLSDSVHAVWADQATAMPNGTSLFTGSELVLQQGYAQIVFDNDASLTVEAPARFQILTSDQIRLEYGRVYATVPEQAYGFTITTADSKVIDLGTEFGVEKDPAGNMQVHVIKGKVHLVSSFHQNKINLLLEQGSAKALDTQLGQMKAITCNDRLFVRRVDSQTGFLWKGQDALNLADIVGGGNGFGGGAIDGGIDPDTGTQRYGLDTVMITDRAAQHRFVVTEGFPFIDSIFIPGFDDQPTRVATTGLTCDQFPTTSATLWGYPFNGAWHEGHGVPRHTLILDGIVLDRSEGRQSLTIHPNMGITFDLEQMRQLLPGLAPVRLRTKAGLSQTVAQFLDGNPKSEFWVLVDGQVRLRKMVQMSDGGYEINIPLSSKDRFVSLAVSDGDGDTAFNWAVFVNPLIELENVSITISKQ